MVPARAAVWVWIGLACSAALGAQQDLLPLLELEARTERQQLADELRRHADARRRETSATLRADELQGRLDALLPQERDPLELEEIERSLGDARATAVAAGEEARAIRRSIYERRHRLRLLAEAAAQAAPAKGPTSPIDGTWRVRILPFDQAGMFTLDATETLVSGSYALQGGAHGAFRGTWAGGVLRLERIDSEGGFDTVYEARLSPDGQRLDGTWQATLLNSAAPAAGTWTATKAPRPRGSTR